MPSSAHHRLLTQEALRPLPAWMRDALGTAAERRLVEECCLYPDRYFDIHGEGHRRAAAYALLIDGIQFHYLPNTPIEGEYKFWRVVPGQAGVQPRLERVVVEPNQNWRHAGIGFAHYFEKAANSLRSGRTEEAIGFLGTLLHVLEDASTFLHSLEGPDGVDVFALDRLMTPPDEDLGRLPTSLLDAPGGRCEMEGYRPALLGASPAEAAFRLYTAYAETVIRNRKRLIPLLLRLWEGDAAGAERLRALVLTDSARLASDAAFTVFSLAWERFEAEDMERLRRVHLSDLKPVREPRGLSVPYRFVTMQRDACLDDSRRRRPLALMLDGRRVTFEKGLGTGCHFDYTLAWDIPAGVYGRFCCAVGLYPDLSRDGDFVAEVRSAGATVRRVRIHDGHPAERIECPAHRGGLIELRVESETGMGNPQGRLNNIVWADLLLEKPAA
jgi:hypothetical protein